MAQVQITLDDADLQALLSGDGGLAVVVQKVLNAVLKAQCEQQLGAKKSERTVKRRGFRNGIRARKMTTRVGSIVLHIPQTRNGHFSTELFSRYQRHEQAFVLALMEMVVNGVSTRKVATITRELCGVEFSKSTVSRLCAQLDPIVEAWNERPLGGCKYPFLLVDAIVIRDRENGRIAPISALIACGIRESGEREILGLMLGDSESEETWIRMFQWLKSRGLHGMDLVTSDNHGGLVKAVRTQFQGVSWQRCQAHFLRNVADTAPKALRRELHDLARTALQAPDIETARTLKNRLLTEYGDKAARAMRVFDQGFDDATTVMAFPESVRRRTRTTNIMERLNREIRRRERVIGIFPNRASAIRLLGALLIEQDEHWRHEERLYLNLTEYREWRKTQPTHIRAEGGGNLRRIG